MQDYDDDMVVGMAEKGAADQQAMIGSAAPAPEQPLNPDRVNLLADTIAGTMQSLTNGQVMEQPEPISEPGAVPPRMYAQLAALSQIFEAVPEGEPYRFDPDETVSNEEGIATAISLIGQAGKDSKLTRALANAAPPAAEEPEAPAESEGPDDAELRNMVM